MAAANVSRPIPKYVLGSELGAFRFQFESPGSDIYEVFTVLFL